MFRVGFQIACLFPRVCCFGHDDEISHRALKGILWVLGTYGGLSGSGLSLVVGVVAWFCLRDVNAGVGPDLRDCDFVGGGGVVVGTCASF